MQLPIKVGLRRSRFLDLLILTSVVLATLEAWLFPVRQAIQLGIVCLAWGLAVWAWLRLKPPFSGLWLERDGQISIWREGEADRERVVLLPGATVHPWLSVFRLKTGDDRRRWLIVACDSLDGAEFRRLRVFLRWRADFSGLSSDGA